MEKILLKDFLNNYIDNLNKEKKILDFSSDECLRIIAKSLNKDKNYIYLHLNDIYLNDSDIKNISSMLKMRYIENIPLQYILGKQKFFKEEYIVNENVLIPRQDTEILVETAIYYINKKKYVSLLDLCTGSGCVGISIANNSNISKVDLVDISENALKVASKNICLNDVKKDIKVILSDLFTKLNTNNKYDIIVSNPPYIKEQDIVNLSEEVKREPLLALDGGKSGTIFYKRILENACCYLNRNGMIIFEIGYAELEDIKKIIAKYEYYTYINCIKDLGGNDRVVVISFNG